MDLFNSPAFIPALSALYLGAALYLVLKWYPLLAREHSAWRHAFTVVHAVFAGHLFLCFAPAVYITTTIADKASALFLLTAAMSALLIPLGARFSDYVFTILPCRAAAAAVGDDVSAGGMTHPASGQTAALVRADVFFLSALGCVSVVIFAVLLFKIPSIPLLDLLRGEHYKNVQDARSAVNNAGYVFGAARLYWMPLLFLSLLAAAMLNPSRRMWLVTALIGALVFFYAGLNSQKTPIAMMLACAGGVVFLAARPSPKLYRRLAVIAALLFAAITFYALLIFLLKSNKGGADVLVLFTDDILGRIAYKPAFNSYQAFLLFPDVFPHTYGRDIGAVAAVTGEQPLSVSRLIGYWKWGKLVNAPPPSLGMFFAQGGLVLALSGMFIAAAVFRATERAFICAPASPVRLAAYVLLLWGAVRISWGYFHTIFLTETIVPVLITLAVLTLLHRHLSSARIPSP